MYYRHDNKYTSDHHGGILRSPASSAPPRFGAVHNEGRNIHARQPGKFRTDNRQPDGGAAPSATLSGTPFLVAENARVPGVSPSYNTARIASVISARAPAKCVDDSHGVVPARGN